LLLNLPATTPHKPHITSGYLDFAVIFVIMKNQSVTVTILLTVLLMSSCIPAKKVSYLQYQNEFNEPETIVKDSLVRKYKAGEFVYRLCAGDLLDIKISTSVPLIYNPFADADRNLIPGQIVNQITDPTRQVQPSGYYVDETGFLNIPVIGKIKVLGYSISEAQDSIQTAVAKYLEKPIVRVKVLNFKFTVLGEVKNDATIISSDNNLTLLQALGMAGGTSEFADLSRVKVLRHYGENTYVFYVNLLNEEFLASPFYFVQSGDVILVAPLKQRASLKYMPTNVSLVTATVSLLIGIITLFKVL
jgi:polysaccharide export outer membrane protein